MLTLVRAALIVGAVVLSLLIVWAAFAADFLASFAAIGAMPWGLVSLVDLYLGFVITATIMVLAERRMPVRVGLVVALFILGNVVAAVWLVLRLPRLAAALSGKGTLR